MSSNTKHWTDAKYLSVSSQEFHTRHELKRKGRHKDIENGRQRTECLCLHAILECFILSRCIRVAVITSLNVSIWLCGTVTEHFGHWTVRDDGQSMRFKRPLHFGWEHAAAFISMGSFSSAIFKKRSAYCRKASMSWCDFYQGIERIHTGNSNYLLIAVVSLRWGPWDQHTIWISARRKYVFRI